MRHLKTLGVVGAGAMGAGIAQIGLTSGLDVIMFDANAEALQRAQADNRARITRLAQKGSLSADEAALACERLRLANALTDLADADILPRSTASI